MPFVLGIDGGGSKSAAAVSDGYKVCATHTAGGCNLNSVSGEQARAALREAVCGAVAKAGISFSDIESVCAGMAGAGSPEIAASISQMIAELLPQASIQVVGDTAIALRAAFGDGPGLVCISGTGSVAIGRNEREEVARAGGWGRAISDEGSGHWIGRGAVSQCLRAIDIGRSSRLITGIMEHWRIATREQLIQRCHIEQPNYAELFPVVLAAADTGDALACELLTAAAYELARITQIVLRRLWGEHSILRIAVTGSVFANSARVRQVFCNVIRVDRPEVQIRLCDRQPFEGALQLAALALPGGGAARSLIC